MSRFKFFVPLCVLAVALLWTLPVAADDVDPTKCLPNCYAKNGVPEGGDGTKENPWNWEVDTKDIREDLRRAVAREVQDEGKSGFGSLTTVDCDEAGNCTHDIHEYTFNEAPGAEVAAEKTVTGNPGDPTESGVPLPFPYLLVIGALLGVLLIGGGIVLRRRALQLGPGMSRPKIQ
jgi:hypothetical protein